MLYVRISLMVPLASHEDAAIDLLDSVANFCNGQPGYLGAYVLKPHHTTGMIGRVTLWEDEESADLTAQSAHMLAVRSELDRVIADGTHMEFGFNADRAPVRESVLRMRSTDALAEVEELLREHDSTEPPSAV
jgi:heme-degrading monooxygenase HmoA